MGQWDDWLTNWQWIYWSSFTDPLRIRAMAKRWDGPLECQYIFSSGSTTVLVIHLTTLDIKSQSVNDGLCKALAKRYCLKRYVLHMKKIVNSPLPSPRVQWSTVYTLKRFEQTQTHISISHKSSTLISIAHMTLSYFVQNIPLLAWEALNITVTSQGRCDFPETWMFVQQDDNKKNVEG